MTILWRRFSHICTWSAWVWDMSSCKILLSFQESFLLKWRHWFSSEPYTIAVEVLNTLQVPYSWYQHVYYLRWREVPPPQRIEPWYCWFSLQIPETMWRAAKTQSSNLTVAVAESWDWIHYLVEPNIVDYNYRCMENDSLCAQEISWSWTLTRLACVQHY